MEEEDEPQHRPPAASPPTLPGSPSQPCHVRCAARRTAMARGEDKMVLVSVGGEAHHSVRNPACRHSHAAYSPPRCCLR